MKLLFAIKALALPGGGAERVLADVTAGLAARGHEVLVVSFDAAFSEDFYAFAAPVRRIRLGLGEVRLRSGAVDAVRRARALRRLAGAETPAVAVGFMHSAYVPLAAGLIGTGIPTVGSEHIIYSHYADRPVERALISVTAPRLAGMTAVNEGMRATFPAAIRQRMSVIANPVRQARSVKEARRGERNRLLSIGRLERQKDMATLVAAFERVASRFPSWDLRIVGEGELRASLEAQIDAAGLTDRIVLAGAVRDTAREYDDADLFALPSRYESFGLVTAEAMSHGLATIGFADCPGTNALIAHDVNGLLVDGDDRVDALAEGLARLMGDEDTRVRLGRAGPATAARFSIGEVVDEWETLLLRVQKGEG